MDSFVGITPGICPVCGNPAGRMKNKTPRKCCSLECRKAWVSANRRQEGLTDADAIRFWSGAEITSADSCWVWKRKTGKRGYGQTSVYQNRKSRTALAHRVAWQLTYGEIPEGMHVCHRCDNPSCVNPSHLFLGSPFVNVHDMITKGRRVLVRGESSPNSKLTIDQVRWIRANSDRSTGELARQLAISRQSVRDVIAGRTWKHV